MLVLFVLLLSYSAENFAKNLNLCEKYCSQKYVELFARSSCVIGCQVNFENGDFDGEDNANKICQNVCAVDDQNSELEISCKDGCKFDESSQTETDSPTAIKCDNLISCSFGEIGSFISSSVDSIMSSMRNFFTNKPSKESSSSESTWRIRFYIPYDSRASDDEEQKDEDTDRIITEKSLGNENASMDSNMPRDLLSTVSNPLVIASIILSAFIAILILALCIKCLHTQHKRNAILKFRLSEPPKYSEKSSIDFVQPAPKFVEDDKEATFVNVSFA